MLETVDMLHAGAVFRGRDSPWGSMTTGTGSGRVVTLETV